MQQTTNSVKERVVDATGTYVVGNNKELDRTNNATNLQNRIVSLQYIDRQQN